MAPDEGVVVFSFVELLFPVCATTTLEGATVTDAILNVAHRQSVWRLLCQIKTVAMTTVMTQRATPTATVTSLWPANDADVDIISVICSLSGFRPVDRVISVLCTSTTADFQSNGNVAITTII